MNYTIMDTEFIRTAQSVSLDKRGNKYGVSISKGGFKYSDDPELRDTEFDCACSPNFDDYESAVAFYCDLVTEFGAGRYSWGYRSKFVREGKISH